MSDEIRDDEVINEDDIIIEEEVIEIKVVLTDEEVEVLQEEEGEFVIYKAELIEVETARIAELNRQTDLKSRWNNLKRNTDSFRKVIKNVPNPAAFVRDLVPDKSRSVEAEELMVNLEAEDVLIEKEIEANKYKELRRTEYGSISDQIDSIYKGFKKLKENGFEFEKETEEWIDNITSIKLKYEK